MDRLLIHGICQYMDLTSQSKYRWYFSNYVQLKFLAVETLKDARPDRINDGLDYSKVIQPSH
jgi:hypothetical protein